MDVDGWLDLVADLLAAPLTALPEERIARQLVATFDAAGCAFHHEGRGDGPPVRRTYPPERARAERNGGPAELHRVVLPLPAGPVGHRSFVVGRTAAFTPAEVALAARLQQLLAGLDRQAAVLARAAPAEPAPVATEVQLTRRELDVLALVADGLTAAAVAHRLDVAERTVHKHLERVYAKLGVSDRVSAVLCAQRTGLLDARAG